MDNDVLVNWLRKLQEEFVRRMEKLDTDTRSDTEGSAEDEDSPTGAGLADMEASDDSNLSE
jgi:DNA mismatch repair protein MSH4